MENVERKKTRDNNLFFIAVILNVSMRDWRGPLKGPSVIQVKIISINNFLLQPMMTYSLFQ